MHSWCAFNHHSFICVVSVLPGLKCPAGIQEPTWDSLRFLNCMYLQVATLRNPQGVRKLTAELPHQIQIQQCVLGARHIMPTPSQGYAPAQGRAGVSGEQSPTKLVKGEGSTVIL